MLLRLSSSLVFSWSARLEEPGVPGDPEDELCGDCGPNPGRATHPAGKPFKDPITEAGGRIPALLSLGLVLTMFT